MKGTHTFLTFMNKQPFEQAGLRPGEYVRDRNTGDMGTVTKVLLAAGGATIVTVLLSTGVLKQYTLVSNFDNILTRIGTLGNASASHTSQMVAGASQGTDSAFLSNRPDGSLEIGYRRVVQREMLHLRGASTSRNGLQHSLAWFYLNKASQSNISPKWKVQLQKLASLSNSLQDAVGDVQLANKLDRLIYSSFYAESKERVKSELAVFRPLFRGHTDLLDKVIDAIIEPGGFLDVPITNRRDLLTVYESWVHEADKAGAVSRREISKQQGLANEAAAGISESNKQLLTEKQRYYNPRIKRLTQAQQDLERAIQDATANETVSVRLARIKAEKSGQPFEHPKVTEARQKLSQIESSFDRFTRWANPQFPSNELETLPNVQELRRRAKASHQSISSAKGHLGEVYSHLGQDINRYPATVNLSPTLEAASERITHLPFNIQGNQPLFTGPIRYRHIGLGSELEGDVASMISYFGKVGMEGADPASFWATDLKTLQRANKLIGNLDVSHEEAMRILKGEDLYGLPHSLQQRLYSVIGEAEVGLSLTKRTREEAVGNIVRFLRNPNQIGVTPPTDEELKILMRLMPDLADMIGTVKQGRLIRSDYFSVRNLRIAGRQYRGNRLKLASKISKLGNVLMPHETRRVTDVRQLANTMDELTTYMESIQPGYNDGYWMQGDEDDTRPLEFEKQEARARDTKLTEGIMENKRLQKAIYRAKQADIPAVMSIDDIVAQRQSETSRLIHSLSKRYGRKLPDDLEELFNTHKYLTVGNMDYEVLGIEHSPLSRASGEELLLATSLRVRPITAYQMANSETNRFNIVKFNRTWKNQALSSISGVEQETISAPLKEMSEATRSFIGSKEGQYRLRAAAKKVVPRISLGKEEKSLIGIDPDDAENSIYQMFSEHHDRFYGMSTMSENDLADTMTKLINEKKLAPELRGFTPEDTSETIADTTEQHAFESAETKLVKEFDTKMTEQRLDELIKKANNWRRRTTNQPFSFGKDATDDQLRQRLGQLASAEPELFAMLDSPLQKVRTLHEARLMSVLFHGHTPVNLGELRPVIQSYTPSVDEILKQMKIGGDWIPKVSSMKESGRAIESAVMTIFKRKLGSDIPMQEVRGLSRMVLANAYRAMSSNALSNHGVTEGDQALQLAETLRELAVSTRRAANNYDMNLPASSLEDVMKHARHVAPGTSFSLQGPGPGILGSIEQEGVTIGGLAVGGQEAEARSLTLKHILDRGATLTDHRPGIYDMAGGVDASLYVDPASRRLLSAGSMQRDAVQEIERFYNALVGPQVTHWIDIEADRAKGAGLATGKGLELAIRRLQDGKEVTLFNAYTSGRRNTLKAEEAEDLLNYPNKIPRFRKIETSRKAGDIKFIGGSLDDADASIIQQFVGVLRGENANTPMGHNIERYDFKTLIDRATEINNNRIAKRSGTPGPILGGLEQEIEHLTLLQQQSLDTAFLTRMLGYPQEIGSAKLERVIKHVLTLDITDPAELAKTLADLAQTHMAEQDIGYNIKAMSSKDVVTKLGELFERRNDLPSLSLKNGITDESFVLRGTHGAEHNRALVPVKFYQRDDGTVQMAVLEIDPLSKEAKGGLRFFSTYKTGGSRPGTVDSFSSWDAMLEAIQNNTEIVPLKEALAHSPASVEDLIENRIRKIIGRNRTSYNLKFIGSEMERLDIAKKFDAAIAPHAQALADLTPESLFNQQRQLVSTVNQFMQKNNYTEGWQKRWIKDLLDNPGLRAQMNDPRYEAFLRGVVDPMGLFDLASKLSDVSPSKANIAQEAYQDAVNALLGHLEGRGLLGTRETSVNKARFTLAIPDLRGVADEGAQSVLRMGIHLRDLSKVEQSLQSALQKYAAYKLENGTVTFSSTTVDAEIRSRINRGARAVVNDRLFKKDIAGSELRTDLGYLSDEAKKLFETDQGFRRGFLESFPEALHPVLQPFMDTDQKINTEDVAAAVFKHRHLKGVTRDSQIVDSFLSGTDYYMHPGVQSEFAELGRASADKVLSKFTEKSLMRSFSQRMGSIEGQMEAMLYLAGKGAHKEARGVITDSIAFEDSLRKTLAERMQARTDAVFPAFFAGGKEEDLYRRLWSSEKLLAIDGPVQDIRIHLTQDFLLENLDESSARLWAWHYKNVHPEFVEQLARKFQITGMDNAKKAATKDYSRELESSAAMAHDSDAWVAAGGKGYRRALQDVVGNGPFINNPTGQQAESALTVANFFNQMAAETRSGFDPKVDAISYSNEMQKGGYEFVESATQGVAQALRSNWEAVSAGLIIAAPMLAMMMLQSVHDKRPDPTGRLPSGGGSIPMYAPPSDVPDPEQKETWQTGNMQPWNITVTMKGTPHPKMEDEEALISKVMGTIKEHFGGSVKNQRRVDQDNRVPIGKQADRVINKIF